MFCRFCGKQNKEGARFCTGCGKLLEEGEAGSAWREPEKEAAGQKPASPGKLLLIVAGVLGVVALVAVIFLAVEIFRTDKGGSFKETDIEQDREEEKGLGSEDDSEGEEAEEDSRDTEAPDGEESTDAAGNEVPKEGTTGTTEPSVWMAGYVGWLEAHEEMQKVSLVAIDDDDIPECLVSRQEVNDGDSTLYILSYRESGIAEYSVAARDICFEVQEHSGRFACMTYSGLGTSWNMVELSDSGFTGVGETYSGRNPENDELFYTVNGQEVDREASIAYIAGFAGDIEICYGALAGDNKNKISVSGQDYAKALQDSYALWSVGGFRDNDRYWEGVQ